MVIIIIIIKILAESRKKSSIDQMIAITGKVIILAPCTIS